MKIHTFLILCLVGLVVTVNLCAPVHSAERPILVRGMPPEQWGDERMAAGNYDSALRDYAKQWYSWAAGFNDNDPETQVHRERLIGKMGQALTRLATLPPAVEYSEFHAQKGATFVKLAKTPADYVKAVKEFQDAVNQSPWTFEYHFNLAVAYKSAGQLKSAINSLKLANLLAPTDKDKRDANALRAEIEAVDELGR